MGTEFFALHKIPDLTLAQYSAEESGGVDDVIRQHASFYRQLNRKGLLFNETYQLIYVYNPKLDAGKRLNIFFQADSQQKPICMKEFLDASSLSSYYHFEEETPTYTEVLFQYKATIAKRDGFVSSSFPEKNTSFYVVNPWKANDKARLMGLFRILQKLEKPVIYVVTMKAVDVAETMRESFRTQIQFIRNSQKSSLNNRDDNAEQCLKIYDKFFESLRNNPHFLCEVSTYAQNEALAKMILDAAASEAVEEGNYRIVCEKGMFQPFASRNNMSELCLPDAPRGMRRWNSLYMLKELLPFAMFPILYPGETIEIPKESAPLYESRGLYLGKDNSGYDVYFPLELLPKHALLAGVPGSGKTYSMLHLSSQLAGDKNNIPILVLEPAKKEYRALARNKSIKNLLVFSPGATGSFPLRINPFEFPIGLKLSEHITNLNKVFEGAFDLTPPMPFLVSEGIEKVYRDHGWYPFEINDGTHTYPSMRELYDKLAELLDASNYAPEVKSNLKSCLQVRIGSLITREMGNVFDMPGSTIKPEEWLKYKCVIELESLGADAANFLTLLLLTIIRELLRQNPKAEKERPRHVIFLEEAHNLIGPTTVANAENGDAKVASTKYIVDMLAEVRALREAIVIADQLPTALASQITKNTSLKLGHRITAMDDRQLLASTMSADAVQLERMASFQPGHALCVYENVQKPFEIQVAKYEGDAEPPTNDELYTFLCKNDTYQLVMARDYDIMYIKFMEKKNRLLQENKLILKDKNILLQNQEYMNHHKITSKEEAIMQKNETNYFRKVRRWYDNWLEYILEINEYCKMNIQQKNKGINLLKDEYKIFFESLKQTIDEYPMELGQLYDTVMSRLNSEMMWIRKKD